MTPTSIRRFIWGLTVFVAGSVLWLQALGIISGEAWKHIWPIFIIIIGIEIMIVSFYSPFEEIEIEMPKNWFKKAAGKVKKTVSKKK